MVAATNKDLKAGIARGEFREDLFFRLNVFPFHLPPLRERREDIPQLLARFLSEYGRIYSKPDLVLSPEAERILVGYNWPGNVRELRNVPERLAIISSREVIELDMVPSSITDERSDTANAVHRVADDIDYRKARETFERDFFTRRLEENEWNISKTSEAVGLERSNLHRKIKQLGIRKEP